jgi:hypothetical protein
MDSAPTSATVVRKAYRDPTVSVALYNERHLHTVWLRHMRGGPWHGGFRGLCTRSLAFSSSQTTPAGIKCGGSGMGSDACTICTLSSRG